MLLVTFFYINLWGRRMKQQIRVLGIDDSPFKFADKNSKQQNIIIGAVVRLPSYIERILRVEITIDGTDANSAINKMVTNSSFLPQLELIMVDGVTLAGFNVVNIYKLNEEIGIPVATITRTKPDINAIELALKKHFSDWEERLDIITKGELITIQTDSNPIYVKFAGITQEQLAEIIHISTVQGAIPEPIRIAHIIASGLAKGESHGKA